MANSNDNIGLVYQFKGTVAIYDNPVDRKVSGFFNIESEQPHVNRTVTFRFDPWQYGKIELDQPKWAEREADYRCIAEGFARLANLIWEDATAAFMEMVTDQLAKAKLPAPGAPIPPAEGNERGN